MEPDAATATPSPPFAEQLLCRDAAAIAKFAKSFTHLIEGGFSEFKRLVPDCQVPLTDLLPLASNAVGVGYLRPQNRPHTSLESYVNTLHWCDLLLVSACLGRDESALHCFCDIVQKCVGQPLRARFARLAPMGVIEDVVDHLPAHCFEQTSKGEHAGMPRLTSYLGQSSLSTWLYATSVRIIQTALRREDRLVTENRLAEIAVAASPDDQPETKMVLDESSQQGKEWRLRLICILRETLTEMPARRRLASVLCWVHGLRPAQIAERMCVSRPRISELLTEAKDEFRKRTHSCLEQIAKESSRSVEDLEELLAGQLDSLLGSDSANNAEVTP